MKKNMRYLIVSSFVLTHISITKRAQINGPFGGYVISFAVSHNGSSDTNLFAGTYGRSIFLSINNGTTWTGV